MLQGEAYERLRWRCIRRGLLELDLILTRFLDEDYAKLNPEQAAAFATLANFEDPELWDLIAGRKDCDDPVQQEVLGLLRKS